MPTIPQSELPRPKSWIEFEDIVWDLYTRLWNDPHAQRYGRSGQAQQGVDIYGQPSRLHGRYAGIQCKRYDAGTLTRTKIEAAINKAEAFRPPLAEFLIATTEPRNAPLQREIREINQERRASGLFRVRVVFWEDLCNDLASPAHRSLLKKHYGDWLAQGLVLHQTWTPEPLPRVSELPRPGELPPGSRLPFHRNAMFTGRVEPLLVLARTLLHERATSTLVTQAVQGMGGVGKTQLAVEFAYRYGRFFQGVHWLNAAQPDLLGAEIALCGREMPLPYWPEEQPEQIRVTLQAWQESGPRLIILDNLENIAAGRNWLPQLCGSKTRVLLTARRIDWPEDLGLDFLQLQLFGLEESKAFLCMYLPTERANEGELEALAQRLGHLPLALELAGRYLARSTRLTVSSYLEKLDIVITHPSMAGWRADLGNPTSHDLDLAATFAMSWEQVEGEVARRAFRLAGYCAPNQPIPCDLLSSALQHKTFLEQTKRFFRSSAKPSTLADLDEALNTLTSLGLLEAGTSNLGPTIHPLLAEYARTLPGKKKPYPLPTLAKVLAKLAHETNRLQLPGLFAPLRPHIEVVATEAQAAGLQDAIWLWKELGYYLLEVAEYADARLAYEKALCIAERTYGSRHSSVSIVVGDLGRVLRALGDYEGARAAYERALAIDRKIVGSHHFKIASDLNSLGLVLRDLKDLEGARTALEHALEIDEAVLNPQDPEIAATLRNLAGLLIELGDYEKALVAVERAMAIDEGVWGCEHPNFARSLNKLARILLYQGNIAEAKEVTKQAHAILQRFLPPDHLELRRTQENLDFLESLEHASL